MHVYLSPLQAETSKSISVFCLFIKYHFLFTRCTDYSTDHLSTLGLIQTKTWNRSTIIASREIGDAFNSLFFFFNLHASFAQLHLKSQKTEQTLNKNSATKVCGTNVATQKNDKFALEQDHVKALDIWSRSQWIPGCICGQPMNEMEHRWQILSAREMRNFLYLSHFYCCWHHHP